MNEKFGEDLELKAEEKAEENTEKGPDFDREAEKESRKEIRKMMVDVLSEIFKKEGLTKKSYSLWQRKIDKTLQLVYLQRSQFSHQYYIEAGICNEKDIPEGQKPDIVYCKTRERIEGIIYDVEKERMPEAENKEQELREKINTVHAALNFEIPGSAEKYPDDYFYPSVGVEEAKEKIEIIKKAADEYILRWIDKHARL